MDAFGEGEGLGGFMDLLNDVKPAPQPSQQRLGSLAQPGPGERGERSSPAAAGAHANF